MVTRSRTAPRSNQQRAYALNRIELRRRGIPALERTIQRFFRRQAADAVRIFLDAGGLGLDPDKSLTVKVAGPGDLIPERDSAVLIQAVRVHVQRVALASGRLLADLMGTEPLTETSPALRRVLGDSGDRIRRINDSTRASVQRVLQQGFDERLTDRDIAQRLRGTVQETYRNRAQAIARTELGLAEQQVTHERLAEHGVTHVVIFDGSGCGWDGLDDGDEADGSIRTIAAAQAQPLSPPNCVRSSAPHVTDQGEPITEPRSR